jgi:hypothetical protein
MELADLETFLVLAEELHFAHTAERMYESPQLVEGNPMTASPGTESMDEQATQSAFMSRYRSPRRRREA